MVNAEGLEKSKLEKFLEWDSVRNPIEALSEICFEVCGLKTRIKIKSPTLSHTPDSLKKHYRHFQIPNNSSVDIEIDYNEAPAPFNNYMYQFWRDQDASWKIKTTNEIILITQRNFVATADSLFKKIRVFGPEILPECFDSIDNVVTLLMSKHLPLRKALIVHAAAVVVDNQAQIFYGDSGVGKSTLAFNSIEKYKFQVLSSDQIYLQIIDNKLWAVPAPTTIPEISDENPLLSKKCFPVQSLIHLTQEGISKSEVLSPEESLRYFLRQVFYQPEFAEIDLMLGLACSMIDCVPVLGNISYNLSDGYLNELNNLRRYGDGK